MYLSAVSQPAPALPPRQSDLFLHPALDGIELASLFGARGRPWAADELADLTVRIAGRAATQLHRLVRFESERRWWARISLDDEVETWLLGWLPGQATSAHDHGGASGAFTVLHGALHEQFRDGPGPLHSTTLRAPATSGFGAGRIHLVGNRGRVAATSVHAYSPPSLPLGSYPTLADDR